MGVIEAAPPPRRRPPKAADPKPRSEEHKQWLLKKSNFLSMPATDAARYRHPQQCGEGDPRPKGRNVVYDKSFGAPRITKDGVTVATGMELEDKFENMGAQMVREVASKTSDVAGDGTTTATVLAAAIRQGRLQGELPQA